MPDLGRLLTAMVTPYTPDGEVDYAHAGRLAAHLVHAGNDGVVLSGTTGESPLLTDEEKARLFSEVREALPDATVVAGSGTNDTRQTVRLTEAAERAGVDGILAVVPYYLKPPQEGIEAHFRAVAESTSLPVVLYDVPSRVGTGLTVETTLRLAEVPNIVGVKEANGNLDHVAHVIEGAPGFRIWSGDDNQNFHIWTMGGYGAISVTAHIVAAQQRLMLDAVLSGRVSQAAAIHRKLVRVTEVCFANGSPSTIRAILRRLGLPIGAPRLPIVEPNDELIDRIMAELRYHQLDALVSV